MLSLCCFKPLTCGSLLQRQREPAPPALRQPSVQVGSHPCADHDTYCHFLSKLKLELPFDPTAPLLGIYLEKNKIGKDTCTLTFIAALFTVAKT